MGEKNALIQKMMDIQYYPPAELQKSNIDISEARTFPIDKLAALGVAFEPLAGLVNYAMGGGGQSGLYYVNTSGKTMFKSGDKYIGSLKAADGGVGGGTAKMTQLPINPTMLFMAVAIASVEQKLDNIYEVQEEIFAFLELKEQAKLKGNLNTLADVLNNYKFNWDNEKYKNNNHITIQAIKREAEQSIILYREQLSKEFGKKTIFASDKLVKSALNKTIARLNDYKLALYVFSFASFLEVMLLENFDSNYLKSIEGKVREYNINYESLYDILVEKLEKESDFSIEGHTLKALSKFSSGVGKIVEKTPVISKTQLSGSMMRTGDKIQDIDTSRKEKITQLLVDSQADYTGYFVENIKTIDELYNQPKKLMFDSENIYILD